MPSFKIGMAIDSIVGAKFPGGHLGWAKAGCDAVAIPVPSGKDVVYILLPDEGTAGMELATFRESVETLAKNNSFDLRWSSVPNFAGMGMADVKRAAEGAVATMPSNVAAIMIRPAVIVISLPTIPEEVTVSDELVNDIFSRFDDIEGIRRVVLVTPLLFREKTYGTPSIQVEQGLGRPITSSDTADLTILLQTTDSIDDFIERM